jgi:hypothetical protein
MRTPVKPIRMLGLLLKAVGFQRCALARLALLLAGLSAIGCAGSKPATSGPRPPPPEDAREFYPLEMGWKWAYEIEKGGEHILAVYAVVGRQGSVATLQAGEERIVYTVLPEGIARRAPGSDSPGGDFLLRSPVRAGAQWPIDGGTATVAAAGKQVDVPAGSYPDCIVVEESRTDPPRLVRTTYAPGVGPVAIEFLVHDPASAQFQTALRASLRGATPPGKDPLD